MLRAVPRSLLMTFFGAFLRRLGGWIAVADLVALMGDAGLDEQAVRSAVSRLKRGGVIAPERRAGAADYRLTEHGTAILAAGDARIFERPRDGAADARGVQGRPEWLLVVFSLPEAKRALRHRLRTRLAWLGLGSVGSAVWVGPAHVEAEVRAVVRELGLDAYVDLFRAAHAGFEPLGAAVAGGGGRRGGCGRPPARPPRLRGARAAPPPARHAGVGVRRLPAPARPLAADP